MVERAVERYAVERPDAAERLEFFAELWKVQRETAASAEARWPKGGPPSEGERTLALSAGTAVFSAHPVPVAADAFVSSLESTSAVIARGPGLWPGEPSTFVQPLARAVAETLDGIDVPVDAAGFRGLVDAVTASPLLAGSASPSLYGLALTSALTPLLWPAALELAALDGPMWRGWEHPRCPVCGSAPAVGRIAEAVPPNGAYRYLWCSLCRTEWVFDRVRCGRCGSRDHASLEYLFDERDPGHRVHVCGSCHGYLKIADERLLKARAVPQVEEVVMLALDALATSRGFTADAA